MIILNKDFVYSRHNNILYQNGIPLYKFTYSRFPDFDVLTNQGTIYMEKYLNMYPQYFEKIMKQHKIKRFFYDTETTGVNYRRCSIHQLSAIIEIDGEVVETLNMFIKPHPNAEITQEALNVGGVTEEQIQAYPSMEEQFKVLTKTLDKYVDKFDKTDKFFFVGFKNASFDDEFLKKYFDLMKTGFWLYFWPSSIDVSVLAAQYLINIRHTMPSFKLHRVAKTIGITVDDEKLHDALYDVELTRAVYQTVSKIEQNLF